MKQNSHEGNKFKLPSTLRLSLFLSVFLMSCGILSTQVLADSDNPCMNCHADLLKPGMTVHGAVTIGCDRCHMEVQSKEHPSQEDSIRLLQNMPGLCQNCHKKAIFEGYDVHAPVDKGTCTKCHDPHSSVAGKLLRDEPPGLCYSCHDREKFTRKHVHKVIIGKRCDCHNPHVNNYPFLLSATVNETCIGCHKAKSNGLHIVSSMPRGKIHPVEGRRLPRNPKKNLTCASCHSPHSSSYPKLFTKKRLCQWCHKF